MRGRWKQPAPSCYRFGSHGVARPAWRARVSLITLLLPFWICLGIDVCAGQTSAITSQLIEYRAPQVDAVEIVWGIDNWQPAPSEYLPPQSYRIDALTHTTMQRAGDAFIIELSVPEGTHLVYCFRVTEAEDPNLLDFWDTGAENSENYHTIAGREERVAISANLSVTREASPSPAWLRHEGIRRLHAALCRAVAGFPDTQDAKGFRANRGAEDCPSGRQPLPSPGPAPFGDSWGGSIKRVESDSLVRSRTHQLLFTMV